MLDRQANNDRLREIVQANRVDGVIPAINVARMTRQLIGLFDEVVQAALSEARDVSSLPLAVRAPEVAQIAREALDLINAEPQSFKPAEVRAMLGRLASAVLSK